MSISPLREYEIELKIFYDELNDSEPETIEGLGVKDDFYGFKWELMMIGMETMKKRRIEKALGVGGG